MRGTQGVPEVRVSYLLFWVHLLEHRVLERESRRLVMLRIYLTPDALWTTASDGKRLFEGYSFEGYLSDSECSEDDI